MNNLLKAVTKTFLEDLQLNYDVTEQLHREIANLNEELSLQGNSQFTIDNITEASSWTAPQLQAFLDGFGIKTQHKGSSLGKEVLTARLLKLRNNTLTNNDFLPTPFGRNYINYWLPFIKESIIGAVVIVFVFIGVAMLYKLAEHYHSHYKCDYVFSFNMYSLPCFASKKARAFLEEQQYNMVYTVLIAVTLAVCNAMRRINKRVSGFFR
jgi:hypothetical protein